MFAGGFKERMSDMLAEFRNTEPVSDTFVWNNHRISLSLSAFCPNSVTLSQGFWGPITVSFLNLIPSFLSLSNCSNFPPVPLLLAVLLVYHLLPNLKWFSRHQAVSFHSLHTISNKISQVKHMTTFPASIMSWYRRCTEVNEKNYLQPTRICRGSEKLFKGLDCKYEGKRRKWRPSVVMKEPVTLLNNYLLWNIIFKCNC